MSWLALLLLGLGTTDLVYSLRRGLWLPPLVGAFAVVLGAGLAGLSRWQDLVVVLAVVAATFAWAWSVTRGFGKGAAWEPLALGGVLLAVFIVLAPWAGSADGLFGDWLKRADPGLLGGVEPDRAMLVAAAFLIQLSTGNVLVRLVLRASGSIAPARATSAGAARLLEAPPHTLKGGRLLGPMERVFILGLGLVGQFTAAGIVVAAKGLLRYPELSAAKDDRSGPGLHAVTEYFLVGSFASWLVALGALAIAG